MIVTTHAEAGHAVEVPIHEGNGSESCDGLSTKQTWVEVLCIVQVVQLSPSDGRCIDSRIAMQQQVVQVSIRIWGGVVAVNRISGADVFTVAVEGTGSSRWANGNVPSLNGWGTVRRWR